MQTNLFNQLWNEICFLLKENIKSDIQEKDYENQVVRAIEKLGWLEYSGEVKRQPTLKLGRNVRIRPDIVIYDHKGNALVAIEIKRPIEDLAKEGPADQLISYMLQMKATFGLLIGKRIRLFYDGKYNYQQRPLLLEKISFKRDSDKGINFVTIFIKENFLKNRYDGIIKELIDKVADDVNIKKLRNILLTDNTKNKIRKFLKEEFSDYGSDVIEGAFTSLDIELKIDTDEEEEIDKEISGIAPKDKGIRKIVFDTIKNQKNGISVPEIVKLTGFRKKQVSNSMYKLIKSSLVKREKRGIYVVAENKELSEKLKQQNGE